MVIRDKIALGTLIGVIGTFPGLILNFILYKLGHTNYYSFQLSGGIYLLKNLTDSLSGLILGGIVWEFTGAFLGIITVYLIYSTGKDYWWLKGVLVSNGLFFVIIYGFFFSLGGEIIGPKVVPWDIKTNYTVLLENTLFGLTASYLTVRWSNVRKAKNN